MTTKNAVNTTLSLIGAEGLGGIRVTARNSLEALQKIGLNELDDTLLTRIISELKRQDLADIIHTGKEFRFSLSVKGIHRLQRAQIERVTIGQPDSWDGLWRMVTYDVPRAQSAQRRIFTRQLERLGFTMIRESVWFHPHPCFPQIETIMTYCGLQRYITLAEISRIDSISLAKLKRAYPAI